MRRMSVLLLLFALAIVPAGARADDDVSGSVTIGGMGVDTEGESAKFDEYRDMSDGTFGDVDLRAFRGKYYLDFSAESLGRDDQAFNLSGGRFGSFTYSLFYDETPHHLSSGNRTFYSGAGGAVLSNTGVASDPMRWNEVDFRRDGQSYGGDGTISFGTPFYLKFGASEKNTDGIYPLAGNSTIGPFGRTTELPAPVNWDETTGFLEGGYRTDRMTASVKAQFSDFDNADDEFFWEDDFATNPSILPDATTLPPDNEYWKISGQLTYRPSFLSSVFALRGSFSQLESERTIRSVVADDAGPGFTALAVEPETFEGDVTYSAVKAAWKMSPAERFDVEIFFRYLDKNNDNTIVDFRAGGGTEETEIFDYRKTSAGFDGTYDVAGDTALDFGYTYTKVDREGRLDNDGSDDNMIFVQVRNRTMARLELRGRYEYLTRDGDFNPAQTGESVTEDTFIRTFVRRYDTADQDRHAVELEAATWLADSLGLAAEFGWEESDYDATVLGLQGLSHYDVYVTADYTPEKFAAGVYFGYENDETDLASRRFSPGDITDPAAGTTGSAFNWTEVKEFDTYAYGIFLEVPLTRRLTCKALWDHSIVNGKAEFTSGRSTLLDLDEVEDYTKQELEVDLVYRFTDNLSVTAGYIYEKFDLDDEQWDDYSFAPNSQTLLGGAYADSDYEASIGFLRATFGF